MKIYRYTFLIIIVLLGSLDAISQRGEVVNQVVIVNSGKLEFTPPFIDYVTVQAYDPDTKTVMIFDTIYTQSAQDVVIKDRFAYVAARDSIIKYNLDTYQRVAAIADSGMSKLCIYDNKLIVSKQSPIQRFFVEILDLNLGLIDFVEGISGDCAGITADRDTVYVAVNQGVFGNAGRLAVIRRDTWTLVREVQLGTNAIGISNLYNYGGKVFSVNKTPYGYPPVGSISAYNIFTTTFTNNVISYTVGDGAGVIDNLLYLKLDEGMGSFNLDAQTVENPVIVPDPGSLNHRFILSAAVDYVNDRLYLNIGNRTGNGIGVVTTTQGDSITAFPEGVSADCIAVDYRIPVGQTTVSRDNNLFPCFPNPANDMLYIRFPDKNIPGLLTISDPTGKIVLQENCEPVSNVMKIDVSHFPSGIYLITVKTDSAVESKKFIKR